MSADNWTTCPKCYADALKRYDEDHGRVMASYGEVSVEEFDKARRALHEPQAEDFQIFREDYEFYGADQGTVEVSYSGRCSACGTGTDFKLSKPFWPEPGEAVTRK